MSGRLIDPKSWNLSVGILRPSGQSVAVLGTVLGVWVIIYLINHVLMCRRPDMAVEIGFKKWNKWWMSGLPRITHMLCFWGY